jgi:hypothetical protein
LARQFLAVAGDGEYELRQIYTQGECAEAGLDVATDVRAQFAGN